jgi:nitrile hydratase beta subunit
MDGIHDLGGMHGFGPVAIEPDEPFFHEPWERRAAGLVFATFMSGRLTGGRYRHAVERMDPAWYLASPYYEHMMTGITTALVEGGAVTQAQLDESLGAPFPLSRPDRTPPITDPGASIDRHRWSVGDAVRVRTVQPTGHTRCPRYVRGKRGTVVRLDGVFTVLDVEAHATAGAPREPTYSVRFEALELWGRPGDPVHVDLWERHLEDPGG